jgi:hypothetical protein
MFLISRFVLKSAIAALLLAAGDSATRADTIEILPSTSASCDEEWIVAAKQLKPGDELILHDGTYSQPCRRAIQLNGLPGKPIVIRAAANARPIITRPAETNTKQNNLEIADSSFLVIRGLHFRGGSIGVRVIASRHITIEDCEISETQNNAIAANRGDSDSLIFRRNHIHHTGLYRDAPTRAKACISAVTTPAAGSLAAYLKAIISIICAPPVTAAMTALKSKPDPMGIPFATM